MCIGMINLRIERQLLLRRRVLSCSAHHRAPELLERQGVVAVGVERAELGDELVSPRELVAPLACHVVEAQQPHELRLESHAATAILMSLSEELPEAHATEMAEFGCHSPSTYSLQVPDTAVRSSSGSALGSPM